MAIELVTGKAGVPHVDSEDVGAFNAYSLGSGAYIMSGCEVTAKSANSVNIAAGEILWEGRHIRVKGSGERLAVDNGQTGYNRRDLITLNYAKDSNGIESVSFAVVKGTATTGTAADPSVKVGSILAGDTSAVIPFARITLSGLSVATPTVLLGSLPSLVSLRDSVSRTKTFYFDSPCMTAFGSSKAPVQLNVLGNVCTLYVNGITTRTLYPNDEFLGADALAQIGEYLPDGFDSEQQRKAVDKTGERFVGCRLHGGSDPHLQMIKDELIGSESEMRFVFTWVR